MLRSVKPKLLLIAGLLGACGGGASHPQDHPDGAGSGSDAHPDTNTDQPYTTLIERGWTITTSGDDQWECRRINVPNDLWISSFRATAPLGTLDEILTVSDTTPPAYEQDDYDCSPGIKDHRMLYTAAANTGDVTFPAGYAVHITAGQWINLTIHLVKPGGANSGTSGVQIQTVDAATNPKAIDMMFAGTTKFTIDHNGLDQQVTGGCNVPPSTEWDVFALWPRMHKIGKHQSVDVFHGGPQNHDSLMDADFTLMTNQTFHPWAPPFHVSSTIGDHIQVTCTYNNNNTNNPAGTPVVFGANLADENCFNAFYKYPAGGSLFDCALAN